MSFVVRICVFIKVQQVVRLVFNKKLLGYLFKPNNFFFLLQDLDYIFNNSLSYLQFFFYNMNKVLNENIIIFYFCFYC